MTPPSNCNRSAPPSPSPAAGPRLSSPAPVSRCPLRSLTGAAAVCGAASQRRRRSRSGLRGSARRWSAARLGRRLPPVPSPLHPPTVTVTPRPLCHSPSRLPHSTRASFSLPLQPLPTPLPAADSPPLFLSRASRLGRLFFPSILFLLSRSAPAPPCSVDIAVGATLTSFCGVQRYRYDHEHAIAFEFQQHASAGDIRSHVRMNIASPLRAQQLAPLHQHAQRPAACNFSLVDALCSLFHPHFFARPPAADLFRLFFLLPSAVDVHAPIAV